MCLADTSGVKVWMENTLIFILLTAMIELSKDELEELLTISRLSVFKLNGYKYYYDVEDHALEPISMANFYKTGAYFPGYLQIRYLDAGANVELNESEVVVYTSDSEACKPITIIIKDDRGACSYIRDKIDKA